MMVDEDTPCSDIAYCSVAVMRRVLLHQCCVLQLLRTAQQLDVPARSNHYRHTEAFLVSSITSLVFLQKHTDVLRS